MRISDWSSDVCSSDLPSANTACVRHAEHRAQRIERTILSRKPHHCGDPFIDHPIFLNSDRATFGANELAHPQRQPGAIRSEERSVGKECVSTCRFRWSPIH